MPVIYVQLPVGGELLVTTKTGSLQIRRPTADLIEIQENVTEERLQTQAFLWRDFPRLPREGS
ncbi:MAG: hypothetical protein QXT73_08260 [Candidatus Methanomethylicaceae archaeon]